MVSSVSPGEFFGAFVKVADVHSEKLQSLWSSSPEWTRYCRQILLKDVAAELSSRIGRNLDYYESDYYTLDCLFYSGKHGAPFETGMTYIRQLEVAIELENDPRRAHEEVWKLQLFNAPLKVLITYPSKRSPEFLLSRFESIIRQSDPIGDLIATRRQVVIFGTLGERREINWSGHAMEQSGFERIGLSGLAAVSL